MIKLSIIVPVYNVEKYLEKCLDSLVNQTLKDIEIIIVNDGSKDNSQLIIDKYAKRYPNLIKTYKKTNGGLSSARNYGIKKAKGEYIAFVDSDDYVDLNMYSEMYKKAISKDFDLVVCNLKYVYDKKIVNAYSNIKFDLMDKNSIKKSMLNVYPAAWNKIYHKRLFDNGVLFKEKVWFEDVEFLYRLYPYIKSIGFVEGFYYNYVQRAGAITYTFDERLFHYIDNWNGIIDFYKNNNFYNDYRNELEYCYVRYLYATFIKRATNFDKYTYQEAVNKAIKNVKIAFPKYRKNKYFYKSLKGVYLILFNKLFSKLYYKFHHKTKKKNKKVLFISSTGGHLSELLQLKSIFDKYQYFLITEKTKSNLFLKDKYKNVSYLVYGTKDHKFSYIFKFTYNVIKSIIFYIRIRPKVIVTTGTHTAVPICYIGKLFRSKIIYIETFANSETKTLSGKLVYPIADVFIVQWKDMLKLYPKAIYGGWIY